MGVEVAKLSLVMVSSGLNPSLVGKCLEVESSGDSTG